MAVSARRQFFFFFTPKKDPTAAIMPKKKSTKKKRVWNYRVSVEKKNEKKGKRKWGDSIENAQSSCICLFFPDVLKQNKKQKT